MTKRFQILNCKLDVSSFELHNERDSVAGIGALGCVVQCIRHNNNCNNNNCNNGPFRNLIAEQSGQFSQVRNSTSPFIKRQPVQKAMNLEGMDKKAHGQKTKLPEGYTCRLQGGQPT